MGGAIFFKACGAGKGQGKKKVFSKNHKKLLRSIIADSCVPRASRRATDLLWRSRVESDWRRSARRERANRSRARGRSAASSRARRHLGRRQPEMTAARAYVLSSCNRIYLLEIPKFLACGAVVLRHRRLFPCPKRGTRRTEEMVVSMASTSYKQYIVVGQVQGCWCGCKMRKYW